jgi:hypothetical protein
MWRKTVLKQASKLVPKNDAIVGAIDEDNKDSNIHDQKPTFNLEECEKKLRDSKTIEQLSRTWSLMPVEAKLELTEVKNEVKKGLDTPPEAPAEITPPVEAPVETEEIEPVTA